VTDQLGCVGSKAAAQFKGDVYFISEKGLYQIKNREIIPIGEGRVDEYFFSKTVKSFFDLNTTNISDALANVTVNPKTEEVYFLAASAYPSSGQPAVLDICLIYSPKNNTWRERNGTFNTIIQPCRVAYTSAPAMRLNGAMVTLEGHATNYAPLASLATSPLRTKLGGRVLVNSVYPNINSNPEQTFLRYATTNKVGDTRTFSSQRFLNSDNKFPIRASGKDVTIKLEFTSSDASPNPVTNCSGIDLDVVQIGQR
jgi:hypothetical protein